MNPFRSLMGSAASATDDDPLAPYRIRAMFLFAIVAMVFLLPFGINSFVQGRTLLGILILGIVVALGVQAIGIYRKRRAPIPNALFLVPAIAAIGIAIEALGVIGALWSYPGVLFLYFALSRRTANFCNALLVVAVSAVLYHYTSDAVAIRFTVTLVLTIVVTHIVLNVIHDLQGRLVELAVTDPLTGAFNRRQLDARLGEAVARNQRRPTPAALLLIDIDHFKRINDAFGHETGDAVLKEIVALIKDRSREFDSLFRIGGEEFLLLLADATAADAANVAEQLRAAIGTHPLLPRTPVTVSIGVSALGAADTVYDWIKRTDDAMYAAKNAGRNRVVTSTNPARSALPWTESARAG